jgi:hypothetical protein
MTGYFLNFEGICKNNPNNCDIFDSVSKRCLKCSNTFYYYEKDGTCVPASFI